MIKKFVRTGLAVALPMALAACSAIDFGQDRIQYETSDSRAPLEIPPDLSSVPGSDRYTVPSRPQTVWASQQAQADASASNGTPANMVLLPQGEVAKIVREGNDRWIHVNMTPEMVWPIMQDFWTTVGLSLSRQDATTGVMETNWAENRAKLPQDIIRATLGRVVDLVYSTGERDQYRARVERTADGGCDIFVTHRAMVEVVKSMGGDNETTVWQPGPSDPEMEAEMLTRLAHRINQEFNPNSTKPSAAEHEAEVEKLATYQPENSISQLEQNAEGVATSIFIKEDFERAWRRLALAVDRMGFTVEDRDRSRGFFLVRYLDQEYEDQKRSEQGFWSNVFGKDTPVEAPQYVIYLQRLSDTECRVHVLGPDGKADTTGVAPRILTLLSEQTK
ncbi:MAG TPA: outer membrane protein assembly factor BamC [Candidatus Aphodousia faecavium]|uniref:Outer membrane protein assembly factor BamC n=1 Tax=Parasutterella secunda TaxID=626947 RepID=A0ABS2GWS1_9BURK|nr:outer membrane protein assembly factor BamC [Parasutterella secunda]MBM6929167.1 outer membrane protein assembly factor BamC [Parasutterella secunda]HIT97183.1 outer membrane protein assembly factor BamC [Candidatus Aphodousia faecavium]